MRSGSLVVDDIDDPPLADGQVRVETIACGICGSDLHCLKHAEQFVETSREVGLAMFDFDPSADVVMGHEFSARILEIGPGVSAVNAGAEVVAHPAILVDGALQAIGYSNLYPGGFGERMVVQAGSVLPIPNGLDPGHAALTEPMAVGLHAVNKSQLVGRGSAIVLGCGPVGLACIAALAYQGIEHIVAADFSPARRVLAERMGAHVVVDPREEPAVEAWRRTDGKRPLTIFEAVGVPGMIDAAMRDAPGGAEILVVGLCMEPDQIWPTVGVGKALSIRFVLGWTPAEFEECLHAIADGRITVAPLITGEVGLDGVAQAFDDLSDPERHAKILVRPNG